MTQRCSAVGRERESAAAGVADVEVRVGPVGDVALPPVDELAGRRRQRRAEGPAGALGGRELLRRAAQLVERLVARADRDRELVVGAGAPAEGGGRVDDPAGAKAPQLRAVAPESVEVAVGRADVDDAPVIDHRGREDPAPGRERPRPVAAVGAADLALAGVAPVVAHLGPRRARRAPGRRRRTPRRCGAARGRRRRAAASAGRHDQHGGESPHAATEAAPAYASPSRRQTRSPRRHAGGAQRGGAGPVPGGHRDLVDDVRRGPGARRLAGSRGAARAPRRRARSPGRRVTAATASERPGPRPATP